MYLKALCINYCILCVVSCRTVNITLIDGIKIEWNLIELRYDNRKTTLENYKRVSKKALDRINICSHVFQSFTNWYHVTDDK